MFKFRFHCWRPFHRKCGKIPQNVQNFGKNHKNDQQENQKKIKKSEENQQDDLRKFENL